VSGGDGDGDGEATNGVINYYQKPPPLVPTLLAIPNVLSPPLSLSLLPAAVSTAPTPVVPWV